MRMVYRAKQALNKNYIEADFLAYLYDVIYQGKAFRMNGVGKMRFNLNSNAENIQLSPGIRYYAYIMNASAFQADVAVLVAALREFEVGRDSFI